MIDGEEGFEVQTILQHRPLNKTRGDSGISYMVKWKGYGPAYNSWEPERLLKRRAPDTLQDYCNEAEVEHLVITVTQGVAMALPEVPTEVYLDPSAES
ncbi:hypothetical protein ABBQ32_008880 [Trebouxia sp. C0010 RCD-2024]